jgi:hypothetical protein
MFTHDTPLSSNPACAHLQAIVHALLHIVLSDSAWVGDKLAKLEGLARECKPTADIPSSA